MTRITNPVGPPIELRSAYGVTLALLFVKSAGHRHCATVTQPIVSSDHSASRMELIPAALFALASLALYLARGKWRSDLFEHWLVLALIIGLAGQTAMSLSTQPYDTAMVDMAATLKIASYVCVLVALLIDTFRMIRVSALSGSRPAA